MLSRLFPGVVPKAVRFYPTDGDKTEKFSAANMPGDESGDVRDPGAPTVTQEHLPSRKSDALRALGLSWVMLD